MNKLRSLLAAAVTAVIVSLAAPVAAQADNCPYAPWYLSPSTDHMWTCSQGWTDYWDSRGWHIIAVYWHSNGPYMWALARD